jgi:hypothetical protein
VTDVNDLNLDARLEAITEMIYVPDNVADGSYLLNLQIASLKMMQVRVNPVLYLTSDLGDEFRDVLRLLQKKRSDGTFSF